MHFHFVNFRNFALLSRLLVILRLLGNAIERRVISAELPLGIGVLFLRNAGSIGALLRFFSLFELWASKKVLQVLPVVNEP